MQILGGKICSALAYPNDWTFPLWSIIYAAIMGSEIIIFSILMWYNAKPEARTKKQFIYPIYGIVIFGNFYFIARSIDLIFLSMSSCVDHCSYVFIRDYR